ncbi:MAG: GldG family protein [Anaerolineales bacterium]
MNLERSKLALISLTIGIGSLAVAGLIILFERSVTLWAQIAIAISILALGVGIAVDRRRIRRLIGGRQARFGSNALIQGGAFVGVLVVVNVLAINHPQRIDLTEDKNRSLQAETVLLLSELTDPVSIIGFYTPDRSGSRDLIRPILDEYASKSDGLVSYEFIDPRANPLAADIYGITRDGSIAMVLGDRQHVIEIPSEIAITSAIVRLSNPENRTVYFLTGHGEHQLDDPGESGLVHLVQALESKSYGVEALNLVVEPAIPADAAALVVAAPARALSDLEINLIDEYLKSGGALVALMEPSPVTELDADQDTLNSYLRDEWGVYARNDFVVDLASMHEYVGLSADYGNHPITERVQTLLTQFPSARSIAIEDAATAASELVLTSARSWGETNFASVIEGGSMELNEDTEAAGPLALAVALDDSSTGARIVVVGDADFATNGGFFAGGNSDLIINSVDWAAKLDNLIDITPRERTQRQVVPATMTTVLIISIFSLVIIPGAILLAGGGVWWRRRRHQ